MGGPAMMRRQKDLKRQDDAREKQARKEQRRKDKALKPNSRGESGEDPDIACIVPGPQPLPE